MITYEYKQMTKERGKEQIFKRKFVKNIDTAPSLWVWARLTHFQKKKVEKPADTITLTNEEMSLVTSANSATHSTRHCGRAHDTCATLPSEVQPPTW